MGERIERFNEWRKRYAWSRVVSYVVIIATIAYVINDIYGIIDTPAVNEVRREITKKGVVNEQEVKAIVRREVHRILAQEGLTQDPRGAGNGQHGGGGSSTGSAPPSQPGPSSGSDGGTGDNGGGSGGGGSTPTPNPPPQPPTPGPIPNVPDVVQEICDTLPPQVPVPVICD
jgi:hypothetical protein